MNKPEPIHRVAIGVITRQRTQIFGELLDSLAELNWPDDVLPVFIFVENDARLSIAEKVEAFRKKIQGPETYTDLETTLGIPFARNRVLEIGLAKGCSYLAFLDDDELAQSEWINQMFGKARQQDLDLVGGPLELIPPSENLSRTQRLCWDFLVDKNARRRTLANEKLKNGEEGSIRIFTNNWLARLDFVRKTGLRFDENLGLSGGSDTRFFVESKKLGAKTGWQNTAVIQDRIPLSRLTLSYQFRRARDQNLALYYIDERYKKPLPRLRTVYSLIGRLISGSVRLIVSLPRGGQGAIEAMAHIGTGLGRVYAAFGIQSTHYKKTTDIDS